MGAVDLAFQRLEPVALLHPEGHHHVLLGHEVPFEIGQGRAAVLRFVAHIGPDNPVALHAGVGLQLDTLLEARAHRFGRHVGDIALHVEFPAVVDAAQPAILVAAKGQRRTSVGTDVIDQADIALAVAEDDQRLAQQLDGLRLAILFKVGGGVERDPVEPHHSAHRGAGADADQGFVILM